MRQLVTDVPPVGGVLKLLCVTCQQEVERHHEDILARVVTGDPITGTLLEELKEANVLLRRSLDDLEKVKQKEAADEVHREFRKIRKRASKAAKEFDAL